MGKRVITGTVYVLVLLCLLALKLLVPGGWGSFGFDFLFLAVSVIGCIEFLNAVKSVSYLQRVITIAFCAMIIPLYVLIVSVTEAGIGMGFAAIGICFVIYALVLTVIGVKRVYESDIKGSLYCVTAMIYCGFLSCMFSVINHLPHNSGAAIIMMFFTVMFTDSFAYIIGSLLKRWLPYKLAPAVSPNKTVIGGVGGLIGGMAGAVVAYYIHFGLSKVLDIGLVYSGTLPAVVAFLLIGLVTSVFGQAGDLFESAIKRKCSIKDMGKILPGHGGILDRFDSMLFGGVVVLLSFALLIV